LLSVALLLASFGSVTPLGVVTIAVLEVVPEGEELMSLSLVGDFTRRLASSLCH
jgi:hypothetical protein